MSSIEQLYNELRANYPKMFPDDRMQVWVDDGWFPIVRTVCAAIQRHIDFIDNRRQYLLANQLNKELTLPEPVEQVVVSQIKEKFGGLRFYYDGGDDYVAGIVTMAEYWAANTCEECGSPGKIRTDLSWHKSLCDLHHYARKQHENARLKPFDQPTWIEP